MTIQQMILASGGAAAAPQIQFKVYGAGGGTGTNFSSTYNLHSGGNGGYVQGTFAAVPVGTVFYIGVGQGGISEKTYTDPSRYNGGARPGNGQYWAGSGGGATHITTFPHTQQLSSLNTLTSGILLVAGAGGGGGNGSRGGAGGGTQGQSANAAGYQYGNRTGGSGGGQNSGAIPDTYGTAGSFGRGGYSNQNLCGGGGAGWYGGSGGQNSTGGGGGSSYVSTNNHTGLGVLTNTANTTGGGRAGGSGSEGGESGSGPGTGTNGQNGVVEIYKNGILDQTFNYTGSIQSYTVS